MAPRKIIEGVYQIGGNGITDSRDGAVYLIDVGIPVMIDSGLGYSIDSLKENIRILGLTPDDISHIILTHCHVDHIGGAFYFRERYGSKLVMHELDAKIVERGDQRLTAAFCFGLDLIPLPIDIKLKGEEEEMSFGEGSLTYVHTPGHTPGSISIYTDIDDTRILFVQDISAPLLREFDCDPKAWMRSVKRLLSLNGDILCDGHSGVFWPKRNVKRYLESCIEFQREYGYI
ncbi:MAG: MBL fold metallo-hydrolase [Syntrophorhabdaceae bacterium]|nr:MBL fold metallo-hydrolase [Syntrophorhabdaceae bacterium]